MLAHGSDATATDPHALAAPVLLAPGAFLAGRYRIERFIAAGGMGEVHQAHDALLDETIAVKLLRQDLSKKPAAQQRFAQEIRLARRVTHRNVCRVFDVGVDGDRVFFTMELHTGETLAAYLARHGALDVATAAPLVAQILAGVSAAHAADVVHADLKPSNILLCHRAGDTPRVVVTDFGMAVPCCATLGCTCSDAHIYGTPAYMAPEQVTGDPLVDAADVFALGVILYEMVTGVLPFSGDNPVALAMARLDREPTPPRALRPELDPSWDQTIRACLARDPRARPRSVCALGEALGIAA